MGTIDPSCGGSSSRTILVVEDEPSVFSLLQRMLGEWGDRVELAKDGPTAMQKIGEAHPDLILLDVRVPKVSGLELLQAARREHPGLPVFVLSGNQDEGLVESVRQLGALDFIEKPFELSYLKGRIQDALSASGSGR